MPSRISRSISPASIGMILALRLDHLAPRLDMLVLERFADTLLVAVDAGRGEVAEDLADHVLVARFLEIGADHVLGIGIGLGFGEPHQLRSPLAEQPIAAGDYPELH